MEGIYLAIAIVMIYVLFGPFVLFGIYIFFDRFAEKAPDILKKEEKEDPCFLTEEDIKRLRKKKR